MKTYVVRSDHDGHDEFVSVRAKSIVDACHEFMGQIDVEWLSLEPEEYARIHNSTLFVERNGKTTPMIRVPDVRMGQMDWRWMDKRVVLKDGKAHV
jgi:hypothetical protein